jgi:hypothetical protein
MRRIAVLLSLVTGLIFSSCCVQVSFRPCPKPPRPPAEQGAYAVDAGGRRIDVLETGSSLHIGARGLRPNRLYEFRLGVDQREISSLREAVSFARASTDRYGNIPPFIIWYQSGVVGCSERLKPGAKLPPFTFRTFEEAERQLRGRMLTISAHLVEYDKTGRISPLKLRVEKAESVFDLPIIVRSNPMVYPSDQEGCLVNSRLAQSQDLYVSGRNFKPNEQVEISIVPNQRRWYVGDPINDVSGVGGASGPERIKADSQGRFTVKVWDKETQRRGVYDIVGNRVFKDTLFHKVVSAEDIISHAAETGFIFYLRYPVGGPTMDIAGRPVSGTPYFQFADSFADDGDVVWGAVDPTYVPDGHAGGTYAAYFVVDHRDVNGWDPAAGGSIDLIDRSGGVEIHRVKAGCINGTDVPIWNPPLALGDYDVVVDFGISPAENAADYMSDAQFNEAIDFLDGADQIGFIVAKDPYDIGSYPIGSASYSQDDYFSTVGGASDVDLRAVVRYPAAFPGENAPAVAGQHPIFVIEHGNHKICEVSGHTHATCPDRTPNHEGYMRLLDILASHGIIAVSVDAYDLTGSVPGWIPERGDLILKHLELWSHMNDPSTFTSYPDFFSGRFLNRVDMNKISVCGHSRGGEASVAAYKRNTDFNIGSVSSIAPVDFETYELPDVPYFVIIPAGDGDVSSLHGIRIYDRAGNIATPVDATTKSGIYVYGANHNFFNTVWADDGDDSSPTRDDYIDKADQQRLGEAYLSAFTRIHLLSEVVYEDMLRGRLIFPSTAGFKIYHIRHEKSHSKQESGSGSGATATAVTKTPVMGPSVHVTQALKVNWTSSSGKVTYAVPVGQRDVTPFEVFCFRVTQTNSALNPSSGTQNFKVELVGGGKTKATYASKFDQIPKPYDHPYYVDDHNVMTTVRIPLHSFIINKSGVTLDDIDTIRFSFTNPWQGEIYVDDIEFSR